MKRVVQTREQVCSLIGKIREDRELSLYDLSKLSGVGRDHICRVENGEHSVSLDVLLKLVNALDCEIIIRERL
ncbi:MAG: helix-turn-helix transcriptional regulator [Prevotellaceae bacterium]|jgi:predicted transcriptional regulator|nr:helix-turn-helix transcriptional regulator [Prevotellaceae bacterium]